MTILVAQSFLLNHSHIWTKWTDDDDDNEHIRLTQQRDVTNISPYAISITQMFLPKSSMCIFKTNYADNSAKNMKTEEF